MQDRVGALVSDACSAPHPALSEAARQDGGLPAEGQRGHPGSPVPPQLAAAPLPACPWLSLAGSRLSATGRCPVKVMSWGADAVSLRAGSAGGAIFTRFFRKGPVGGGGVHLWGVTSSLSLSRVGG